MKGLFWGEDLRRDNEIFFFLLVFCHNSKILMPSNIPILDPYQNLSVGND